MVSKIGGVCLSATVPTTSQTLRTKQRRLEDEGNEIRREALRHTHGRLSAQTLPKSGDTSVVGKIRAFKACCHGSGHLEGGHSSCRPGAANNGMVLSEDLDGGTPICIDLTQTAHSGFSGLNIQDFLSVIWQPILTVQAQTERYRSERKGYFKGPELEDAELDGWLFLKVTRSTRNIQARP
ncbi:hypothetical protein BDR06DRAFT_998137 [Suillus hirtellus]|nr:hypothetical protein BDR06DRAFT_998137 [Suillus hirtellus]